jgi:protein-S-isoprenylcysteine O-methyltransferase Ste14
MTPIAASFAIWTVWVITWMIAAAWSARAAARPAFGSSLPYLTLTTAGFLLLFAGGRREAPSLWVMPSDVAWALTGLSALGAVFAWWARLHLGALWSGTVTRKADHHIVDTGPYGLERHPIYTGIILGAVGVALQAGSVAAVLGALLLTAGFWVKARLEEGFLAEQLGSEAYAAYRRRSPMLIPFLRRPN